MPEIKNNFLQGKMNKDLDERLIPNGQYRHAENVEVSTAEDASVGVVKNILGNKRVEDIIPPEFKCVGSIADEKNNKLYWFITTYGKDAIIEYDAQNDITSPVIVDKNASNYKAVLKFSGNIITGINIIDNLLFWTDNRTDPKKINIDECKAGTVASITSLNEAFGPLNELSNVHTQLIFDHGSFDGMTLEITASSDDLNTSSAWPPATPVDEMRKYGKYFYYQRKQLLKLLDLDFNEVTNDDGYIINAGTQSGVDGNTAYTTQDNIDYVRHYRNGKFLGIKEIMFFDNMDGLVARLVTGSGDKDWYVGDVIFGIDVNLDIEERHITVIKPKPLNVPSVKINHSPNLDSTSNIPNLFETKFPRFSYRYKYRDGEFSPFAPFTNPVFNPKYTKDPNKSSTINVLYDQNTAYDIKEPQNKAMVNSIHSIELTDFITAQTPEDVVEIDILYKQENSSVIYSIGTIKHIDPQWHAWSNNEGANIGFGKQFITSGLNSAYTNNQLDSLAYNYAADGGYTKGKYIVTTENIYAALPANQLLRPWDNVPRKALAQEIVGNRIVYGNYLQNYNMGVVKPEIKVSYGDRSNQIGSFSTQGLPSIKSQRNYQLGVIYCDKYGRETPVFTSDGGAISVPWQEGNGTKNASKSLQINTNVAANFPEWVDSLKFFVKETSNEYYNLVMDKAWVTKSTYELDNSEGHLWISFPSSDRNKISEEDYIILKKKVGVGEEQINFENKFKVIDIKNEAPDAIKYELINMGVATDVSKAIDITAGGYFTGPNGRPDRENGDLILINIGNWKWDMGLGMKGIPLHDATAGDNSKPQDVDIVTKDLYISWKRLSGGTGVSSKKYKIQGGRLGGTHYLLKLSTPISKVDADIAHVNGDSSDTAQTLFHSDLILQVEKRQLKDSEDFSGKFFVKISKNQVTDLIESGEPVSLLDQYQISAKTPTWYWQDRIGTIQTHTSDGNPASSFGLTNWYGSDNFASTTGGNSILNATNNVVGPNTGDNPSFDAEVTDHSGMWSGILSTFKPTFFIDAMYMASGQSEVSNYAKYNCVLWSGCTMNDDNETAEDSAWSYAPFKTWLTNFKDSAQLLENLESDSENPTWYNGNLISTSPLVDKENPDWNDLKVDGWIGSLQNVNRTFADDGYFNDPNTNLTDNHINGLEGIVTTNSVHAVGPRRWFSGITGSQTEHGVGNDAKTYSDDGEVGRHFMHLSFFAPGKNLHNNDWGGLSANSSMLYGSGSWAANLQGIWGGGHFTGSNPDDIFGLDTDPLLQHFHLPMEGNNAVDGSFLPATPGPGVGYGYDIKYKELHERQWDPTFNQEGDPDNKIRDFIRNLHPGSQFKFSIDTNEDVYTIKKVVIKKLYNHTSWRNPYNRWTNVGASQYFANSTGDDKAYWSVEKFGLAWLNTIQGLNDNGQDDLSGKTAGTHTLRTKIRDFGASHNRRLCYIIELDENPFTSGFPASNTFTADFDNDKFANIEFLEPVQSILLSDLSKFPAIWEVDPRKKEIDLDIYYEASNSIPVRINNNTNELFGPIGCKVEVLDSSITSTSRLMSWDNTTATFEPGFVRGDGVEEIDYTGLSFKFTREDGSFTIVEAGGQQLVGESTGYKTDFNIREDIGDTMRVGLSWYNCFSFGNGIESNRIRDDFNEMFIGSGVKASTTTQEIYEEEHRLHGLIYSGLYNSNSGVNDLNQFIMAEKSTKDLNPTYGSIQKLFQRRISLIAFCEDRVVSITSNKDAIYNADGNPQLISSSNVLGDANPFVGNYGISKNPESFASESYRAYFTDKQRGAVIRLSKDGLTPISKTGMHDWFRDNLPKHTSLIGTYDSYKEDYNITLMDTFGENIIYDSFFATGEESTSISGGLINRVTNPYVFAGSSLQYPYDQFDVLPEGNNTFGWGTINQDLNSTTTITNHAAIPYGSLQQWVDEVLYEAPTPEVYSAYFQGNIVGTGASAAAAEADANNNGYSTVSVVNWAQATYQVTPGTDNGWWYDPRFTSVTANLFGALATDMAGPPQLSVIKRVIGGVSITESNNIGYGYPNSSSNQINPSVQKTIYYPISSTSQSGLNEISQAITRNSSTNAIVFDRPDPFYGGGYSYVEFKNITTPQNVPYHSLYDYNNFEFPFGTEPHAAFFNGDEIHIQFELTCYVTFNASGGNNLDARYGYNFIIPKIELFDGSALVPSSKLKVYDSFGIPYGGWQAAQDASGGVYNPYAYQQTSPAGMGGDFAPPTTLASNPTGYLLQGSEYRAIGDFATSSASVSFPDTQTIGALLSSSTPNSSYDTPRTIVVGASFKFKDPTQQNANGSWNGTSGVGIEEAKVINDLRIRISNNHPKHTADYDYPYYSVSSSNKPLRHQLWEINNLLIKKGFGVTAPHTNYEPEIPITSGVTTQYAPGTPMGISAVDAVPPYDVPAWTEVEHQWLDAWGEPSGALLKYTHAHQIGVFGDDYSKVSQSGLGANPGDATSAGLDPPNVPIPYDVPIDWGYDSSTNTDQAGITLLNTTLNNAAGSPPSNGTPFLHTTNNSGGSIYGTGYAVQTVPFDNEYLYVKTGAINSNSAFITQSISNTPWADNQWYLVDVEVDYGTWSGVSHPNSGAGSEAVIVRGVASASNYVQGGEIDSVEGVGRYRGGAGDESVQLMPVTRTEYDTTRTVLRGIFQFAPDSPRSANSALRNTFELWVYNVPDGIRIQKIITKKLSYITPTGSADNWTHETSSGPSSQVHAFSKREIYFKGTKLCFDVPANQTDTNHKWVQEFNTANTELAPGVTPLGWRLNFTVSNNPDTGNNSLADGMGGFVARDASGDASPPANGHEGLRFVVYDIGDYEIKFTMDGINNGWTIEKDGVDYLSAAILVPTSSMSTWTNTSTYADKIVFGQEGLNVGDLRMAISNILLTDETIIFQGGSAGAWNFDGFVTSENNWIYWDATNLRLTFVNTPTIDPSSTGQLKLINANQWIDKPIAKYEAYNIEFTHGITSGKLSMYYFNAEGFGFKILDIDSSTPSSFSQQVEIGDQEWESVNPINSLYTADLKETFVVAVYDDGELVNGWVDNISMTQVFYPLGGDEKTLTFSEDVSGWTSFKSFVPESGVSLSKKYFTMKSGGLFQHYVPMVDGTTGYTDEEANNYNVFYNQPDPFASIIKLVLNNDPSTIKTFNTLNYEGSQAYVVNPGSVFHPTLTDSDGLPVKLLNINNAQAWALSTPTASPTVFPDIDGWNCTEIKTDLDMGSVVEFVKKEGKWFNYIKGKTVSLYENLDTSRFSVQGIGVASGINAITIGNGGNEGNGNGNGNGGNGNGGNGNGGY